MVTKGRIIITNKIKLSLSYLVFLVVMPPNYFTIAPEKNMRVKSTIWQRN